MQTDVSLAPEGREEDRCRRTGETQRTSRAQFPVFHYSSLRSVRTAVAPLSQMRGAENEDCGMKGMGKTQEHLPAHLCVLLFIAGGPQFPAEELFHILRRVQKKETSRKLKGEDRVV